MSEKQETSADIIAEMRIFKCRNLETGELELCNAIANYFADRLEAAHKREKVAIEADALAVGGIVEAAHKRETATAEKSSVVDTKFELCNYPEQVLKIGRDFQNKDGFRGAHYDTVKLLCDTIEYQQEQLKTKTEVGDAAKLREALVSVKKSIDEMGAASLDGDPEIMLMSLTQVCARLSARIDAALAEPVRNCDRFGSYTQAKAEWWKTEVLPRVEGVVSGAEPPFAVWLFSLATEKEGGAK